MKADLCTKCGVALNDANWYPSAKKRRWLTCSTCELARQRAYSRSRPDIMFNKNQGKVFGIKYEQYLQMEKDQNGVCAICKKRRIPTGRKYLCIDHCHKTGKIRGLLCVQCNAGIGNFMENPETVKSALEYICSPRM